MQFSLLKKLTADEDSGWTSQKGSNTHLDFLAGPRLELHN